MLRLASISANEPTPTTMTAAARRLSGVFAFARSWGFTAEDAETAENISTSAFSALSAVKPPAETVGTALATRRREIPDRRRHRPHPRRVFRAARVLLDRGREPGERRLSCGPALPLSRGERVRDGGRARGGETLAAHQLIQIRPHHGEGRRPDDPGLALRVVLLPLHQLRRRQLVGRELVAGDQLAD